MRREDRELLSELAQVNTTLPTFAQRVMDNTATPAEHCAISARVIALGQAIDDRAGTLTVINADSTTGGGGGGGEDVAVIGALSALVDMTDALNRTIRGRPPAHPARDAIPADWPE